MRYAYFPRTGTAESLTFAQADIPRPQRGQVLVKMHAASLNYRDLIVAKGGLPAGKQHNLIPLSDGAGEVVDVGDDVSRVKVGERVAGLFFQKWQAGAMTARDARYALGGTVDGVLAQYRLFDEDGVVAIPDYLSYEQAATLPCAALTAWHALFGGVQTLRPGQTVLLLGTGGVSMFALQFAKLAGARVILISSSDEKLDTAHQFGADVCINYRQLHDWHLEVLKHCHAGVDHVVEVGGAGTLARSVRATRPGGAIHLIGVLTQGEVNPAAIMQRGLTLEGIHVGSRAMFEAMNQALCLHELQPVISQVYRFDEAVQAYEDLAQARHLGKLVISLADA